MKKTFSVHLICLYSLRQGKLSCLSCVSVFLTPPDCIILYYTAESDCVEMWTLKQWQYRLISLDANIMLPYVQTNIPLNLGTSSPACCYVRRRMRVTDLSDESMWWKQDERICKFLSLLTQGRKDCTSKNMVLIWFNGGEESSTGF